jgi:5-methyltetrahydrofolate--homocysteine methyltransferase
VHTVLRSATREVVIGPDQPFCIIGERINPTGRPKFQERLRAGDLSQIEDDVRAQVAGGAMVLDINMGVPLADEADLLARAIRLVQSMSDLPICIDSSVVEALEAGLQAYCGKALVNSVTGEQERLDAILPLVKRYGAAVIALPNEEDEIPEDPRKRLEITRKIVDIATSKYDIPVEDIVIDPLAMPIGANHQYGVWTMEAMSLIRDELGVNLTCGASNISFGMPGRHALNAGFLPMAMTAGLTSAIMDARTPLIIDAVKAADLMLGNDEWGANWIGLHRARQAAAKTAAATTAAATTAAATTAAATTAAATTAAAQPS